MTARHSDTPAPDCPRPGCLPVASGDPLRTDAAPASCTRAPPGTATPAVAGWPDPEPQHALQKELPFSKTFHALPSSTVSVWLTTMIVSPSSPLRSTPLPTQKRTSAQLGIQGSPQADADLHVQDDLQRCTSAEPELALDNARVSSRAGHVDPPTLVHPHPVHPSEPHSTAAFLHRQDGAGAPFPTLRACCAFVHGALSLLQAKARLPHGRCHSLPVSFTKPFPC